MCLSLSPIPAWPVAVLIKLVHVLGVDWRARLIDATGHSALAAKGCLMHARGETVKRGEVVNEFHGMILIDVLAGGEGEFDRSFLERTGHPVVVCHGPGHAGSCPLLAGAGCELVDSAHGIVFALDLDQQEHRAILRRYHEVTRPEVPIRAVVRPGQRERYADELGAFDVWEHEPTVADLDGFAAGVDSADRPS
jgi:hypothetical protein